MFLYRLTNGIIGGRFPGATILLLTTIGRKSGQPRTTPLRYLRQGEDYMIVASNWGQGKFPAWFYNIQANPAVTMQVMSKRLSAQAEVAPQQQQAALYRQFIEADKQFAHYQETANRSIPVIFLHPKQ